MTRLHYSKKSSGSNSMQSPRASTVPGPPITKNRLSRFFLKSAKGSGKKHRRPRRMSPFNHREVDLCPIVEVYDERFPEEACDVEPKSTSALDFDLVSYFDDLSLQHGAGPMVVDLTDPMDIDHNDDNEVEMYASPVLDKHHIDVKVASRFPSSSADFFPPGLPSSWACRSSHQPIPNVFIDVPSRDDLSMPEPIVGNDVSRCSPPTGVRTPVNSVSVPSFVDAVMTAAEVPQPVSRRSFKQKVAKAFGKVKDAVKVGRSDKSLQKSRSTPYARDGRLQDKLLDSSESRPKPKKIKVLSRRELTRWFSVGKSSANDASTTVKTEVTEASQSSSVPEEPACGPAHEFYAALLNL